MLALKKAFKVVGNGPNEKKVLLNKIDLSLKPGEFVTVVGGNGAGKSTLFNCISGTMPLTSGQVMIDDQNVTTLSEEKRARFLARFPRSENGHCSPYDSGRKSAVSPKKRAKTVTWSSTTPRTKGNVLCTL